MSKIKVLPDSLANKIAAGEVVERPSSVVKELLENALDAGARSINIEVEAGGKRLIRIVDDGEGMNRDDAIIAFERHATSKLRTPDDLEAITTLGFRGEALPSIASVSRLFLRTKTARDEEGTEVEFNGGKLIAVRDIAWPGGTEVEVRDLFFNIPARRKFLKSDATESFHIANLVQHYALANPQLSFLLVGNGRDVIRVAAARSLKERAYQVLGAALLEKLVEVNSTDDGLKVLGFVSNPQEQRSSRDAQYLFINCRFVRDQLIGRALTEAYRSMMPSGTHPAAVLFIEAPPAEVDVNVHPAKTEVRFLHEGAVLAFVRAAVAEALRSTQPITQVPGVARSRTDESAAAPAQWSRSAETPESRGAEDLRRPLQEEVSSRGTEEWRSEGKAFSASEMSVENRETIEQVTAVYDERRSVNDKEMRERPCATEVMLPAGEATPSTTLPGFGHGIKPLGQIRDSYIVATDEEGLLLVDQHVAHERVLFEQFRDARLARAAGLQPLLIPATLDLSPSESEAFSVVEGELENIGIETMRLSGRTIAIKTAPAGLGPGDVMAVFREVLTVVERERRNPTLDHIRDGIAAELACKAAIKVNMPLTSEKMQWLIDELMKTQNPMTCPHGRPIMMRMGLRDIERGFKRPV
ncbi:MAG TPA: DNA mismatch repair endonuclease MutL [Blastocatellia bacterium]|nr:DNA mismatch repair endonuclease MutL [Blastocatellia bacterium]